MAKRLYLREQWLKKAEELYKNPKKEGYSFAGNVHKENLEKVLNILRDENIREDFYAYNIQTGDAKLVDKQNKLEIRTISGVIENNGNIDPNYCALFVKIID